MSRLDLFQFGKDAWVYGIKSTNWIAVSYSDQYSAGGYVVHSFDRLTVKRGRVWIRGLPISAGIIAGRLSAGDRVEDILVDYPELEPEDFVQVLRYSEFASNASQDQL